jgi:hypothetical protein
MKKFILSSIFALALLATAGWGVNKSMGNDANLSDLALANVEALAQNEDGEFEIVCGASEGDCWDKDYYNYINCGEYTMIHPCVFSGYKIDSCYSPCA